MQIEFVKERRGGEKIITVSGKEFKGKKRRKEKRLSEAARVRCSSRQLRWKGVE